MGLDIGFYKVLKEKYDKTEKFENTEQIKYFGGKTWIFIPRFFYKDIFICEDYEIYDELIITKEYLEKFREECIKYKNGYTSEIYIRPCESTLEYMNWIFSQLISWIDKYLSEWDDNYYLIIYCY